MTNNMQTRDLVLALETLLATIKWRGILDNDDGNELPISPDGLVRILRQFFEVRHGLDALETSVLKAIAEREAARDDPTVPWDDNLPPPSPSGAPADDDLLPDWARS